VRVDLAFTRGEIHLTIEDFGHGFDRQDQQRKKRGLGLISMEERVRFVGGKLTINSRPGRGTRVLARIPLKNKQ
jgi:signal transduction histidine kinase